MKTILQGITNENNIWVVLKFVFEKYEGYIYNEKTRIHLIAKFHLIFEEMILIIFDLKLNCKIRDEDLFNISNFLNEQNFAKMFLLGLYEYLIVDENDIDNRLKRVFGGFMKVYKKNFLFFFSFIKI